MFLCEEIAWEILPFPFLLGYNEDRLKKVRKTNEGYYPCINAW